MIVPPHVSVVPHVTVEPHVTAVPHVVEVEPEATHPIVPIIPHPVVVPHIQQSTGQIQSNSPQQGSDTVVFGCAIVFVLLLLAGYRWVTAL